MIQDALICRKGPFGWRWCVVPLDLVDAFRDHGWIAVLRADEMHDIWNTAIEDVRQSEIQRPINPPRWRRRWCNGD